MSSELIKLNNIVKSYGQGSSTFKALKEVNLVITDNEYVALMGTSGSGKSTLMNIISCLDSPTNGHYYLKETDVSEMSDDDLSSIRNKEIGIVFQSFNLLKRKRAWENVALPLVYAGIAIEERKKRAINMLKKVGLENKSFHYPNELSGGQHQRIAIARALINNPSLLLADEPTGNLDSENSKEIMQLFKELHNQGNTIVMVTHEDDIAACAQRTVTLKDGIIIKDIKN